MDAEQGRMSAEEFNAFIEGQLSQGEINALGKLFEYATHHATEVERKRCLALIEGYSDGPSGGMPWAANLGDVKAALAAKIKEV